MFVTFLWERTTLAFFHSVGNFPCFIQDWNIKSSGLQIDLQHSFNMRMLNMSWPWALSRSRFRINVVISSLVNVTVEIDLPVFFLNIGGNFTGVIYYRTLFSKKAVKQFCLLFKISYVFILMNKRRYARKFKWHRYTSLYMGLFWKVCTRK